MAGTWSSFSWERRRPAGSGGLRPGLRPNVFRMPARRRRSQEKLLGISLAPAVALHAAFAWKRGWWTRRWRLFYPALALSGSGFLAFLWFWNLLGFRY